VEQLGERVDRALRVGVDRLAPIRQVREETELLRQRLADLEAALNRLESDPGDTADGRTARKKAAPRKAAKPPSSQATRKTRPAR
jgi:hypothetical protein